MHKEIWNDKNYSARKKIICQNPQSPFCYFAWPTVKRLPDGTLITVCSGFRLKHVCAFGKVIATYSRDGAKTRETDLVLDNESETHDLGYPATVELSDGRFLTVYYQKIGDPSVIIQKIWSYN